MIVLDASALIELVLSTAKGRVLAQRIEDPALSIHIPHLADLEVAQVLRRRVHERELLEWEAEEALDDLCALDLQRHEHWPLLPRIWRLRANLTAYDAVYVALADILRAQLLTCDARMARAPGLGIQVALF